MLKKKYICLKIISIQMDHVKKNRSVYKLFIFNRTILKKKRSNNTKNVNINAQYM